MIFLNLYYKFRSKFYSIFDHFSLICRTFSYAATTMDLKLQSSILVCFPSTRWNVARAKFRNSKITNFNFSISTTSRGLLTRSPSARSGGSRTATSCASNQLTAHSTCSSKKVSRLAGFCPDFCFPDRSNMPNVRTVLLRFRRRIN